MISFNYETEFSLENEQQISNWISSVISEEEFREGEINYIFCDHWLFYKQSCLLVWRSSLY